MKVEACSKRPIYYGLQMYVVHLKNPCCRVPRLLGPSESKLSEREKVIVDDHELDVSCKDVLATSHSFKFGHSDHV